jgi:tRNA nucleotidyltransferase (CCA-adding enzyme)
MGHLEDRQMAMQIARLAAAHGGHTYYVGGFVRDALLGKENKDVDIEVHGITPHCLEEILDSLGQRMAIGESFGIFGLKGYSLDIAMPRKEEARGQGHRDFDVFVDPFLGTNGAARRRDFTVNALMMDVLTGEIVDPYGGQEDLKAGVLRHVCDETFPEDPLRVLRGAQFAARFGFIMAPETIELCSRMDLSTLPKERILMELEKALLKAERPSFSLKFCVK